MSCCAAPMTWRSRCSPTAVPGPWSYAWCWSGTSPRRRLAPARTCRHAYRWKGGSLFPARLCRARFGISRRCLPTPGLLTGRTVTSRPLGTGRRSVVRSGASRAGGVSPSARGRRADNVGAGRYAARTMGVAAPAAPPTDASRRADAPRATLETTGTVPSAPPAGRPQTGRFGRSCRGRRSAAAWLAARLQWQSPARHPRRCSSDSEW
jgi:hypothetical protein